MSANENISAKQAARSFQDVSIWQKAHQWVLGIYRMTDNFPKNQLTLRLSRFTLWLRSLDNGKVNLLRGCAR